MKILFLTNYPAPYRVEFFNKLGLLCNLTVVFDEPIKAQKHRNSKWFNSNFENFNVVLLSKKFPFTVINLLKDNYDLIVIGTYSTITAQVAIEYLNSHKISFVIETDGGFIKSGKGLKELWKKHLISSANAWLSPSKAADDYLKFYGANDNKIYRYPFTSLNQMDFEESTGLMDIEKSNYRKELGMKEKKIILSVGRFSYKNGYGKGYDTLMNTSKLLPKEYGIYIVGDEPTEEFIKWKEEQNLRNVHFVGFKTKNELAKYYLAANLFVLMTIEDVWGLVVNEAMLYKLPIITSDKCLAGVELISNGNNGYVIPVGDYNQLAEKCKQILGSDTLEEKYGAESYKRIQEYTIENMVKSHLLIFDEVYNNR